MAFKFGLFDAPLGAEREEIVSTAEETRQYVNMVYGVPEKYKYSAADLREQFRTMYSNGIVAENLNAPDNDIKTILGAAFDIEISSQETEKSVYINSGAAWLNGTYFRNTEPYLLSISDGYANDIKIKYKITESDVECGLTVTQRLPSESIALNRSDNEYELLLYTVTIESGESITASAIEDHRLDLTADASDGKPRCGLSAINTIKNYSNTVGNATSNIIFMYGLEECPDQYGMAYVAVRKIGTTVYMDIPQMYLQLTKGSGDNYVKARLPKEYYPKQRTVFRLVPQNNTSGSTSYDMYVETNGTITYNGTNMETFSMLAAKTVTYEALYPTDWDDSRVILGNKFLTGTLMTDSDWIGNVSEANKGDMYVNTETGEIYQYTDIADNSQIWTRIYTLPSSPTPLTSCSYDVAALKSRGVLSVNSSGSTVSYTFDIGSVTSSPLEFTPSIKCPALTPKENGTFVQDSQILLDRLRLDIPADDFKGTVKEFAEQMGLTGDTLPCSVSFSYSTGHAFMTVDLDLSGARDADSAKELLTEEIEHIELSWITPEVIT